MRDLAARTTITPGNVESTHIPYANMPTPVNDNTSSVAQSTDDDTEYNIEEEEDDDGAEELYAALETLCLFKNHEDHPLHKGAYDRMMEILESELGMSNEKIEAAHPIMKELDCWGCWVESNESSPELFDEAEDQSDVCPSQQSIAEIVDMDLLRLLKAADAGELAMKSWFIDLRTKWRITKFPPLHNTQRNIYRAEFLHRIFAGEQITLWHNAIVAYHIPSAQIMNYPWCIGYHCHTTSLDLISTFSSFCGNKVILGINSIVNAIHQNIEAPTEEVLCKMQTNKDPTKIPDEKMRASDLYKSLFPDREVLPSFEDLKRRLGQTRLYQIIQKCKNHLVLPDKRSVVHYLKSHAGCHMIIPGLWLDWKSLCSSPHLFDIFATKLEKFLKGTIVDDDDNVEVEETDGRGESSTSMVDNAEVEESDGRSNVNRVSSSSSGGRKYEQIKEKTEGDMNEHVAAMKEYLENGDETTNGHSVMKMLRGKIKGALTETESRDSAYLNTNFIHSVASQMTKCDRFRHYRQSIATEHGRYMACAAVSKDYIMKVGGVALGGCHNTPGHDYLLRLMLPVPMFRNHIIEHGVGLYPITKMVCMVMMKNYCRSALEVHQFQFSEDLKRYSVVDNS